MYNKFVKIFGAVALMIALTGCTDKVGDNEFNITSNGSNSQEATTIETAVGLLKGAMPLIHDSREHKYQYQFNLHIDNYAGYLVVANSLQGRLPRTYSPNPDFETGPRANFLWVAQQVVPVMNSAEKLGVPEMGAIAAIIYNFAASEYVDVHGPMPYTDHRVLKSEPPLTYQKVQDIYKLILEDLDKQQQILRGLQTTAEMQERLNSYDLIAGKKLEGWVKLANSLRMRLAMRMVKAAPEQARQHFEAAFAAPHLTTSDEDIKFKSENRHPLFVISKDWDDARLNANFLTLLKRLHHPGLRAWFTAIPNGFKDKNGNISVNAEGVYAGMRAGMQTYPKEQEIFGKSYKQFSIVNGEYAEKPIYIFKASEVQFLLAEAALRGWAVGGTAGNYYEMGIAKSFNSEGLSGLVDYLPQRAADCPPIAYVDYWDDQYSVPAEVACPAPLGVEWDASLTQEQQLEMIITQKYIANYPLSLEAWSDHRRTGYPRMMPNVSDDVGDSSIPPHDWRAPDGKPQPDLFIHRIPFVRSSSVSLDDIRNTALPALAAEDGSLFSGKDYQAAHIWWDVVGKGNF